MFPTLSFTTQNCQVIRTIQLHLYEYIKDRVVLCERVVDVERDFSLLRSLMTVFLCSSLLKHRSAAKMWTIAMPHPYSPARIITNNQLPRFERRSMHLPSHLHLVSLMKGKWYYEAVLFVTTGCLQIGWAYSSFASHNNCEGN